MHTGRQAGRQAGERASAAQRHSHALSKCGRPILRPPCSAQAPAYGAQFAGTRPTLAAAATKSTAAPPSGRSPPERTGAGRAPAASRPLIGTRFGLAARAGRLHRHRGGAASPAARPRDAAPSESSSARVILRAHSRAGGAAVSWPQLQAERVIIGSHANRRSATREGPSWPLLASIEPSQRPPPRERGPRLERMLSLASSSVRGSGGGVHYVPGKLERKINTPADWRPAGRQAALWSSRRQGTLQSSRLECDKVMAAGGKLSLGHLALMGNPLV